MSEDSRKTTEAIIERIVEHTSDIRSFFLHLPHGQHFSFIPGQFLSLQLPIDGKTLTRPYSIASNPEDEGPLEICLNLVSGGQGSHYLFSLRVDDVVHFTGPWGTFVLNEPPAAECVFLADGIGVVPIRSMIHRALLHHSEFFITLLYNVDQEQNLLYREEFQDWTRQYPHFAFEPLLPHPSSMRDEVSVFYKEVESRYVIQDQDRCRHFYICGVGGIVTQLRDLLRGAGYQRQAVRYEKW